MLIDLTKPMEIVSRFIDSDNVTTHPVTAIITKSRPRLIVSRDDGKAVYSDFRSVGFLLNGEPEYPDNPWRLRNAKVPFAMTEAEARQKIKNIDNPEEKWRPFVIKYFEVLGDKSMADRVRNDSDWARIVPSSLRVMKTISKVFKETGFPE